MGSEAVAARIMCTKKEILKKAMERVMEDDVGEGVILRMPKSPYIHGRTDALVKIKASRGDAEALVVDSANNSLSIKLPNGTVMEVRKDQVKFGLDPKKGDVVTYEFERISRKEIPVNIKIDRIRHDTSWETVLHDFLIDQEKKKEQRGNMTEQQYSEKPARYWTTQQGLNSRKFLENFAKSKGFDPHVPENWYKIRKKDFPRHKGLIDNMKGGYVKALLYLFPDIGLIENKFISVQKLLWKDVHKRRNFFDAIAKANKFDPLVASNWYSFPQSKIYSYKSAQDVMKYYKGNLGKALFHVYPDINLNLSLFDSGEKLGLQAKNRQFFISIASDLQFDPLVAKNWYSISKSTILNYKGALTVLSHHGHSFRKAVVDLFPDIAFEKSKFLLWNDVNDRRKFFDRIAKDLGFDPLVAEKWSTIKRDKILSYKGGETVLSYHNNSYKTALRELYPEVDFTGNFLKKFENVNERREFFVDFARKRGLDPLLAGSWVPITRNDITSIKGGEEVLSFHNNNHRRAILQLFPNIGLEDSREFMWGNPKDRREFFDKFAKEIKRFDPLIAENWYDASLTEICSQKGGEHVLSFHNDNLSKALADLYPNIGIQKSRFAPKWNTCNLRRHFFDEIARDKNFDPLVPSNWFYISSSEILKYPGANKVLSYHGNNHKRALEELYPSMERFEEREKIYQRSFFDQFAAERKFDPLVPINWYPIVRDEIFAKQGGKEILKQYENSHKYALPEIYPNIGLDKNKFMQWDNKEVRRAFLDKIAKLMKFDPLVLNNWKRVSESDLQSFTSAQRVLAYHGKSIMKAVKDLYPEMQV